MGLLAVVHLWKLVPLPTAARAIPHELSLEHCQDPLAGQLPNTDSIEATLMKHQFCWVCYQNAWYTTAKAHTLWPVARWWSLTAHTGASYCITRTCWNVISKHVTVYYSIWDITYQPSMPGSRPLWSQSCPAACRRSTLQNLWFKNWAVCPREESQEDGLTLTTSVRVDRSLHYMGNPI